MKRFFGSVWTLVCAGALVAACSTGGGGGTSDGMSLRVAYATTAAWLPAWVAQEEGIFKKHGLSVNLTAVQNVSTTIGALGHQFDIVAETPPDLIQANLKGLGVTGVAGNSVETADNSQYPVLVRDQGIQGFKDIAGVRVATPTTNGILHVGLLYSVLHAGGDPSKVKAVEVPFPNMADQLKAGQVDAVESAYPFAGAAIADGARVLGSPLAALGDRVVSTIWMSNTNWARSHSPALSAWRASLNEASALIGQKPDLARKVLASYTKLPPAVVSSIRFPVYDFNLAPADLTPWAKAMKEIGYVQSIPSTESMVTR